MTQSVMFLIFEKIETLWGDCQDWSSRFKSRLVIKVSHQGWPLRLLSTLLSRLLSLHHLAHLVCVLFCEISCFIPFVKRDTVIGVTFLVCDYSWMKIFVKGVDVDFRK